MILIGKYFLITLRFTQLKTESGLIPDLKPRSGSKMDFFTGLIKKSKYLV